jgi:hypothetical protein
MISIWRFVNDSWEIVEEMEDDLALAQRLIELRQDGNIYRAEKRTGGFSSVLEV